MEKDAIEAVAAALAKAPPQRIVMTGCGDSLAVMIGARLLLEQLLGIPCEPVQALDFAYYGHRTVGPGTLLITLSSSGMTTRTVEAMLVAKAKGAQTLALSNTVGSALMAESDLALRIHAERKGWPTQASTAAMALLMQLGIALARALGRSTGGCRRPSGRTRCRAVLHRVDGGGAGGRRPVHRRSARPRAASICLPAAARASPRLSSERPR